MYRFKAVLTAVTVLWTGAFLLLLAVSVGSAMIREHGSSELSSTFGTAGSIVVLVGTARCAQPRVIKHVRESVLAEALIPETRDLENAR